MKFNRSTRRTFKPCKDLKMYNSIFNEQDYVTSAVVLN